MWPQGTIISFSLHSFYFSVIRGNEGAYRIANSRFSIVLYLSIFGLLKVVIDFGTSINPDCSLCCFLPTEHNEDNLCTF